jgi:hypothetical protein
MDVDYLTTLATLQVQKQFYKNSHHSATNLPKKVYGL